MAIKALEDSVHGHSAPLFETMTIRRYCTYYRIANEVYEAYHQKRRFRGRIHTDPQNVPEELRDVVYYKRKKFMDVTEMYDIDSPEDFMRFATDHYGELGAFTSEYLCLTQPTTGVENCCFQQLFCQCRIGHRSGYSFV